MKLAAIFKDGMILQRNRVNRIWGTAKKKEEITIIFSGRQYHAAKESDRWYADLAPMDAGGPYRMQIKSSLTGETVIGDIWFGEVWLAGGQSNMELPLEESSNGAAVCREADFDLIRFYNVVKRAKADEELLELEKKTKWCRAKKDECRSMSAVAFYFARQLHETLKVPVGIIDCYWGGTSATCWMSRKKAEGIPEAEGYIAEWDEVISSKSQKQYEEEMIIYDEQYRIWNEKTEKLKEERPGIKWEEINELAGRCPWPQPMGADSPFRPFGLYDTMIKRTAPYGIKGFLYYQGEEDWSRASYYYKLNCAVIDQWREVFSIGEKTKLPFILTQLPMYLEKGCTDEHDFTALRQQQTLVSEKMENVAMAVLIDCGEFDNIHPVDKETPGKRLALQALGRFYDREEMFDNMKIRHAVYEGAKVRVSFENTYGEVRIRYIDEHTLTACSEESEINAGLVSAGHILGFEVSGDGENFYAAQAAVADEEFLISAKEVERPVALRYGWMDYGVANVYNAAGLPLAPFYDSLNYSKRN